MTFATRTLHPYYPRELVLDHYVPNTYSTLETLLNVLIAFFILVALTVVTGYPKRNSTLNSRSNQLAFFWFVLCGCLHTMFEGYYLVNHKTLAGDLSPVAQAWKEYALSDSRYLSADSFVLSVELITCLGLGPLSLFCAWSLYHDLPSRHITQLILSLYHIYSCVLYYWTSLFEGSPECHPDPYYYYFYFWFFNLAWMVVPIILLTSSIRTLNSAMEYHDKFNTEGSK